VRLQTNYEHLQQIHRYVLEGVLPAEEKLAKRLVLERERFVVLDNVLYYVDQKPRHQLRVAVPKSMQQSLMEKIIWDPLEATLQENSFAVS